MTELFGRRLWRTSYSKKSLPHYYATERQFSKFTKILTSPHSWQKTVSIISMTLFRRMHQYPKLFPKFIPRFKLGTLIKSNLNLRYWKIRTQALSQNLALYKLINWVVSFTCYLLHWLRFIRGKKASLVLWEGGRIFIVSSSPSPRTYRRITWTVHW